MNVLITTRQTQYISAAVSLCFLFIHVAMLVLFGRCGVTPMVYVNMGSITFYLLSFVLIRREMFRAYAISVYLEVVMHMTLAVACVGWDAGFQVTLIGMSFLAFFSEYLGRSLQLKPIPAVGLCLVGMCAYVFGFEYVTFNPPQYPLPSEVAFWLQVAWGFIVFIITVFFLHMFVFVTFESEQIMSVQLAHDELTGLPNRYYIADYLHNVESKEGLEGYWLAMADIDDFKHINDTYGHNCGDYVLKTLAKVISDGRTNAELCRWGGEEFLLVGKIDDDMQAQCAKLERLRKTIEEHGFWYDEHRLGLTVTIGVTPYVTGSTINEWINMADKKLYEGKCSGKNCLVA